MIRLNKYGWYIELHNYQTFRCILKKLIKWNISDLVILYWKGRNSILMFIYCFICLWFPSYFSYLSSTYFVFDNWSSFNSLQILNTMIFGLDWIRNRFNVDITDSEAYKETSVIGIRRMQLSLNMVYILNIL